VSREQTSPILIEKLAEPFGSQKPLPPPEISERTSTGFRRTALMPQVGAPPGPPARNSPVTKILLALAGVRYSLRL
jgi:hypothetical protein